jgi:6-phosphogluconolactonase
MSLCTEHSFGSVADLSAALAADVTQRLQQALAERGNATLAVSGGKSPVPVFAALRQQPLNWSQVTVLLVDERVVPHTHADSNTALVHQHLLQDQAAAARFVTLFEETADLADLASDNRGLEQLVQAANRRLAALHWPLDVVLLGMGEDGHTASLFPGAPGLAHALQSPEALAWVRPATAPHARITLTLPRLLQARHVALSISGDTKRAVYAQACTAASEALPVSLVLHGRSTPVHTWLA